MGSARSKSLIIAALGAACILIAAGLIIAIVLASKGDHPPKPTSASSESGREATPSQQLASEQPATTAQQVSPVVARSAQAGVPLLPPLENGPGEERQEYFTKGRLLQRQGQFERALQYYQKSAESAASPALRSAAILSQAELLFRQRRHAEAIDVLQGAVAILEDDARVRALILKGRCLSQQQRHEEAAACFEEVVRSGTEKARVDMAQELLFRAHQAAGTLDDVIEARNRTLEERPDDERALRELLAVYTRARPNTEKAIEVAQRLLELQPDDIALLHLLADVALSAQDGKTAVAACERLLELDSANSRMLWERLLSAYTMMGESDKALKCARKLFEGQEPTTSTLSAFAGICARIGKNEEAIEALKQGVGLAAAEERDAAQLALAGLYQRTGELTQAIAVYQHLSENARSTQTKDRASRLLKAAAGQDGKRQP